MTEAPAPDPHETMPGTHWIGVPIDPAFLRVRDAVEHTERRLREAAPDATHVIWVAELFEQDQRTAMPARVRWQPGTDVPDGTRLLRCEGWS